MRKILSMIGVVAIVATSFFLGRKTKQINTGVVKEVTIDTIKVEVVAPVPAPKIVERIIHDSIIILAEIDTMAILCDYFDLKTYIDTLVRDSSLNFILREKIGQNRILERSYSYEVYKRSEKMVINDEKLRIYGGVSFANKSFPVNITVARDWWAVTAGYDPIRGSIVAGVSYRIR